MFKLLVPSSCIVHLEVAMTLVSKCAKDNLGDNTSETMARRSWPRVLGLSPVNERHPAFFEMRPQYVTCVRVVE